jgi:hypothetical protein
VKMPWSNPARPWINRDKYNRKINSTGKRRNQLLCDIGAELTDHRHLLSEIITAVRTNNQISAEQTEILNRIEMNTRIGRRSHDRN